MAAELESLREWIGRRETAVDYITVPAVHRLAATLDRDDPMPQAGDPLPAGWHVILFPRVVRQSQIGPDGHPQRGDFVPPVPLPRRMNGGKRLTFHSDLRVGDEVHRDSVIQDLQFKKGRGGRMVVVTVRTDVSSPRGLAVTEEQDILYRDEADSSAPSPTPTPAPTSARWQRRWIPDPVMLFRFSAITFNGHRIHYDEPYVTRTEGYPERIVNGSLSALLVFELARQNVKVPVSRVSVRNMRAMFVNRPLTVCGESSEDGRSARFWIADSEGAMGLSAEFTLA